MEIDLTNIQTNETEPEVPIKVLRKILSRFNDKPNDFKLGFSYIMTACFPTVFDNIMSFCKDCYTQGYIKGKEDGQNETNKRSV